VLGVVFAGAWLATFGVLAMRFGRPIGAFALGLGAMALFMTFSARPAATCELNGTSTGLPLAWSIRGAFDPAASSMVGSGSSGTVQAAGQRSVTSGEIKSGSRVARYSCDGDRLVDYREDAR
jgi:hypothetical protein